MNNYIDELRELAKLKDEGIITDNEFQQKKGKLLSENLETSTIKTEGDVQSKKEEISPNIVDSDKKTEFSKLKKPNSKEWLKKVSKVDEVDEVNEKSINKSNKSNSHIKSEWGFRFIIFSFILSGFLSFYVHKSFFLILMIISPILVIMLLRKFGITGPNVKNKKIIKSGNEKYKKGHKYSSEVIFKIIIGVCFIFILWIWGVFDPPKLKLNENNLIQTLSKQKGQWIADVSHIVGFKYYYKVELNSNGTYTEYSSKRNKSNWEVQSRGNIEVHKYDITGGRFDYGDRYIGIRLRPNDGSFAHLYRIGRKSSKSHYIPNVGNGREITQLYAETKGANSYYLK